ncbi:MAG: hypothetical protein DRQ65_05665 [Gammaproteobacteria bacterium]|nr:MAG: hypothetical protein DRQ65_05665 [Gammaproteobacteria bacterium]
MRKQVTGTAIFLVLLLSFRAEAQDVSVLYGTWEWVSTQYADGLTESPETLGYTVQLTLTSSSIYLEFRNEELQRQESYVAYSYLEHLDLVWVFVNYFVAGEDAPRYFYIEYDTGNLVVGSSPLFTSPAVVSVYSSREAVSVDESSWGYIKAMFR